MTEDMVTIPYAKNCFLRLLPSEIKPYLPESVIKLGLKRGKPYKRTMAIFGPETERQAEDVAKLDERLLREKDVKQAYQAPRQPYKGNKPYRTH